jgi:molybdopterin synthase catalytic subunit
MTRVARESAVGVGHQAESNADSRTPLAIVNMIQLTDQPIDVAALLDQARSPEAGAIVLFLGTTREVTDGRRTVLLNYEAYREMAERQFAELEAEARRLWPLAACLIVHRLGLVPPGEASVAIVVSTPHRHDAFAAGQWLIDAIKEHVPIWKREQWSDGTTEWRHEDKETRRQGDRER